MNWQLINFPSMTSFLLVLVLYKSLAPQILSLCTVVMCETPHEIITSSVLLIFGIQTFRELSDQPLSM